jgi:hypothetical protein
MAKWRRHSLEFKRQAVERMKTCANIQALARGSLRAGRNRRSSRARLRFTG